MTRSAASLPGETSLEVPSLAGQVALAALAMAVFVGLVAFCLWWLRRPSATFGGPGALIARGVATGAVGGLVMIPIGLFLIVIGFPVGLYSEQVAVWVLGFTTPSVLFIEHMAISSLLAVVLVLASAAAIRCWSTGQALAWGAGYGAVLWLVVNSLALPLAFGEATPWELGFVAVTACL